MSPRTLALLELDDPAVDVPPSVLVC